MDRRRRPAVSPQVMVVVVVMIAQYLVDTVHGARFRDRALLQRRRPQHVVMAIGRHTGHQIPLQHPKSRTPSLFTAIHRTIVGILL